MRRLLTEYLPLIPRRDYSARVRPESMIAFTDSRMVNGAFSCLQEFVAALSFPGELQKLTCRQSSILIDATRYLQPLTSLSP
jgi:hypothetical protein